MQKSIMIGRHPQLACRLANSVTRLVADMPETRWRTCRVHSISHNFPATSLLRSFIRHLPETSYWLLSLGSFGKVALHNEFSANRPNVHWITGWPVLQ